MAKALFPTVIGDDGLFQTEQTHNILDDMMSKGNLVAEVRKAELVHLETLFLEFTRRVRDQDFEDRIHSTTIRRQYIRSQPFSQLSSFSTSLTISERKWECMVEMESDRNDSLQPFSKVRPHILTPSNSKWDTIGLN